MHIRWLEDFVCLAQAGSLARAAELRNVTPPAFGRRMQAVEVWAGAPLIDRSAFPVRLTAEGRQFLEAAQSALRTLDETRLALRAAHRADASTVTIATGKTPDEHKIGHFVAVNEKTGEQLPVTSQMRAVKALWNIFSDAGRQVGVLKVDPLTGGVEHLKLAQPRLDGLGEPDLDLAGRLELGAGRRLGLLVEGVGAGRPSRAAQQQRGEQRADEGGRDDRRQRRTS